MQQINAAYAQALQHMDGQASQSDAGQTYTYTYNAEREQELMDKIGEVIRSGILDSGVEVYLIGTWLWAMGETKPHRETLGKSGLGFSWSQKRQAWSWHTGGWYRPSRGSLSDIAARYGAEKIAADEDRQRSTPKGKSKPATRRKRIAA
jgi:hypothetical protein